VRNAAVDRVRDGAPQHSKRDRPGQGARELSKQISDDVVSGDAAEDAEGEGHGRVEVRT
jgi:hypothetical protein